MRRRPWPIVILAALQVFVEPITNLLFNSWASHTTPSVYIRYFVQHREWLSLFYLFVLPPVMGACVYAMKKWSYGLFIACSTWMLWENFGLVRQGTMPLSYAIAIYVGNIGFVSYFLLPQVTAPYMNPKLRWWESKARFLVDWPVGITPAEATDSRADHSAASGQIRDFSEGGVFLTLPGSLQMDQHVLLRIQPSDWESIEVQGRVVFSRPLGEQTGYGLQFTALESQLRKDLSQLAKQLKKSGAPMRGGQESSWENFKTWARTLFTTGHGLLPETEAARMAVKTLSGASTVVSISAETEEKKDIAA